MSIELSEENVNKDEVAHVIAYYGQHGGVIPNPFIKRLIEAIDWAPLSELEKLAAIYPTYVAAVELVKQDYGQGIIRLQELLEIEPTSIDILMDHHRVPGWR